MLKKLYEDYCMDVYRYLLHLTHDPAVAEDLTSETFLAALGALPRFRGESSVKTWLLSIARNTWLTHLRKHRGTVDLQQLTTEYLSDGGDDVEKTTCQKETVAEILALLEQEPERNRRVVLMRVEGYSHHEIARALGISESSARVIDHRTRKKIKLELEQEGFA